MASKTDKLFVKIVPKGFKVAGSNLTKMRKSLLSIKSLIGGLVAGYAIKKLGGAFLDAAKKTEQLQVRLQVLLGSVEEGNRLFEKMTKFASEVPFEFEQIMESATMLSGIMKGGVDEITEWMPLIGDLAATTGLTILESTEQVQRMLSAGAASADKFRERGVLAMLGFTAGVSYSTEETRTMLIDSWEMAGSKFRGATDKLANTWSGQMSMMADKWYKFRMIIMDADVFKTLTESLTALNNYLEIFLNENEIKIKEWTHRIMVTLIGKSAMTMLEIIEKIAEIEEEMVRVNSKRYNYYREFGRLLKERNELLDSYWEKYKGALETEKESVVIAKEYVKIGETKVAQIEQLSAAYLSLMGILGIVARSLKEVEIEMSAGDKAVQRMFDTYYTGLNETIDTWFQFGNVMSSILTQAAFAHENFFAAVFAGWRRLLIAMVIEAATKAAIIAILKLAGIDVSWLEAVGEGVLSVVGLSKGVGEGVGAKSAQEGGYTGEFSGIFHKHEYVIPEWMVARMPGTIAGLESVRAGGGSNVTNNINLSQGGMSDRQWFRDSFVPMFKDAQRSGIL